MTVATPVPVPYVWLDQYPSTLALAGGDYEAAALADIDGDGHTAWQEYVAGSCPTNHQSIFRSWIDASNGDPQVTWTPNLGAHRTYAVEGKSHLNDVIWGETNNATKFFRVTVEMPSSQ